MSRPKAQPLPETHRECRGCKVTKPLNLVYFSHHRTGRNGWQPRCRVCMTEFKRAWRKAHARSKAKADLALKPGEHCNVCEGLAHRRPLTGCPRCKLAHVPLPPIQPVLRKFDWAM